MNSMQMFELTEGFHTKADKMRVLERAGVSRAEIARFLGVRYQQVRNTLEGDKRTGFNPELTPIIVRESNSVITSVPEEGFRRLIVLEDENVALPTDLIEDLIEDDGELYALRLNDGIFVSNAKGMARRAKADLASGRAALIVLRSTDADGIARIHHRQKSHLRFLHTMLQAPQNPRNRQRQGRMVPALQCRKRLRDLYGSAATLCRFHVRLPRLGCSAGSLASGQSADHCGQ
jgi:hypothetical protein